MPEATPVYEATRLKEDLTRARINNKWWIINSSLYSSGTTNKLLLAKASNEIEWINKINKISNNNFALIGWKATEVKGDLLRNL